MNTWTTQLGYPVVHVKYVNTTVHLRQERFFFKENERNSVDTTWHIPITWATYNNLQEYLDTAPKLWLTGKEETFSNLTLFSLFNVQQSGKIKNRIYENIINIINVVSILTILRSAITNVHFFSQVITA